MGEKTREETAFTLSLFLAIGVNFPGENPQLLKKCLNAALKIYFSLYSVYCLMLSVYMLYYSGFGGELLTSMVYFTAMVTLRLHFIFKAQDIVNVIDILVKFLSSYANRQRSSVSKWILGYLFFNIILASSNSFKEFLMSHNSTEALGKFRFLLFDYPVFNKYILILAIVLEFTRNFLELVVPALTVILLCVLYRQLITLMSDVKYKIANTLKKSNSSSREVQECCELLHKVANIIRRFDQEMSLPLFYLIVLEILQIMVLITIFASRYSGPIPSIVFLFLACNSTLSLFAVCVLASKIPETYAEIKTLVLASDCMRKGIYAGKHEAVSFIGIGNMLNEMTDSFKITAMGVVKIDKAAMITIFSSIFTYGVILFQMFQYKQ